MSHRPFAQKPSEFHDATDVFQEVVPVVLDLGHSSFAQGSMVHKLVSKELRPDIRTQGVVETKDDDWQCQSHSQFHG